MERFEQSRVAEANRSPEQLPENIVSIELPEARYRILYEDHDHLGDHSVEEIRGADAIAFEGVTTFSEHVHLKIPMDPEVVSHIREKDMPIYLFDIESAGDYAKLYNLRTTLQSIEQAIGEVTQAYAGVKAAQALIKREVNRRDALKIGTAAVIGVKGYLAQDVLSDKNRQLNAQERGLVEAREKFSPELDTINFTLRNALWAYKLKTVIAPQERERVGRKPEIASIVGYNHVGLEAMLQKDSEELLRIISGIMDLLKKALRNC